MLLNCTVYLEPNMSTQDHGVSNMDLRRSGEMLTMERTQCSTAMRCSILSRSAESYDLEVNALSRRGLYFEIHQLMDDADKLSAN